MLAPDLPRYHHPMALLAFHPKAPYLAEQTALLIIHVRGKHAKPPAQNLANAKGTGLGLSITKQFAELLGESIGVESQVGKGSSFTVRVPVVYTES